MPKLGQHMTDEARAKSSASHMGISHVTSSETKAKISASERGKAISPETRARIARARSRQLMAPCSPERRAKQSASMVGHAFTGLRHYTAETCLKISVALWRGGKKASKARRRLLGFVPLNEPFVGCEGHHVDNERVIYIPKALHRSIYHRQRDGRGMAQMNALAYNFMFKQEVEAEMAKVKLA